MKDPDLRLIFNLLTGVRWAALATLSEQGPEASHVAFVAEPDFSGVLLHLSGLAAHTRNLGNDPRASLAIGEADCEMGDPQTLARLSLHGRIEKLPRDQAAYGLARKRYLARIPTAEALFGFSDFKLFRLVVERGRLVGGFGRARDFSPQALREAASLPAK
ncbi:MAG: pyridoxamine 5'-phosphate oxidase family protein [Gammaproteobacteria bacterium]|nr:pyridoxamine 5'-phosphate oxidase family protein [Gammaproteobacteria bacterium]MCP5136868.1 pyridoxamine 5'-phosphate oxidase family protein [Gammaproteobacteria bacterium]